jgi:hypothetical protein
MRKKGSLYEYIAVYVDYVAIAMKNPKELTDILETTQVQVERHWSNLIPLRDGVHQR